MIAGTDCKSAPSGYPYGLKHTNYNANLNAYKKDNNDQVQLTGTGLSADLINKYKFNGMEYQDELGLNMTAMDYRQYDNTIGRFNSIDALAELSYSYSPFAFGFNNPVYWADPTGLLGEGSSWLDSIWNNSGSGTTIWTNDNNGSFSTSNTNLGSGGMVDIGSGVFTGFESLSEVTVYASKSGRWANSAIGTIQSHVYWNSSFYQGFRVRQFSGQIDDLQSMLDGLGTIDPTGIIDGANALGYLARGQRGNAAIAAIGILPYIGDAAKGAKYTKSTLKMGQEMHAAYKSADVIEGAAMKEFRLPSGKRIDFLDLNTNTIYELKPFNPRAMKAGNKQLQIYKQELQAMPQFRGTIFNTVLDTY